MTRTGVDPRACHAPPAFEHHREPLGIGESAPRLSWRTVTDTTDWRQAAHQVEITAADGTVVADTGRVSSAESLLVPWPGRRLGSRERVAVRVRVWGEGEDEPSPWSQTTYAETGLLEPADWTARPITPDRAPADEPLPVALLRRDFAVPGPVASARLYITAYGVYEAEINGERVGDHVLAPAGPPTNTACATRPSTSPRCCGPARTPSERCSAKAGTPAAWASTAADATSTANTARSWPSWRSCTPTARR